MLTRRNIELSLCMIVRDNADTIEAALGSIKPWVDEMIVVPPPVVVHSVYRLAAKART